MLDSRVDIIIKRPKFCGAGMTSSLLSLSHKSGLLTSYS